MGVSRKRSAIVTGGARGIGAAIAAELVKEGLGVVIGDLSDDVGHAEAASLGRESAAYRHLDVTSAMDWQYALDYAESNFGPLRVVVNNAGIVDFGSVETESPMVFKHVVEVNLFGPYLGLHTTIPALRAAGGGVVVNVSSTAGLTGYANVAGYVASKWGLRGLTKAAALELGQDNIRVCSVHPGPIHTRMTEGLDESIAGSQPIPRFGEPEEVARLVRFIVSEATYSTGSEFVVDGGATAGVALDVAQ